MSAGRAPSACSNASSARRPRSGTRSASSSLPTTTFLPPTRSRTATWTSCATSRAMQSDGPGVASLSMDDRMTIANMAIEAGGKNAMFEFDSRTQEYVDARTRLNGTKRSYEPVEADKDQKFVYELVVDLSK